MCFKDALPFLVGGLGGGVKYLGEKKAAHAQERAYAAEQARQNSFTGQQQGAFEDSLTHVRDLTDPNAQQRATDAREGTLAAAIAPQSGSFLPGSSSASPVVATAADKAAANTHAQSLTLAHTLAALGGASDALQTANTAIGRNSGKIGQIASFKQGSAGVLDAEMRAASHKGEAMRALGGLAQQIALAYLTGGASGGANPFAGEEVTASGTAPVYGGKIGGVY